MIMRIMLTILLSLATVGWGVFAYLSVVEFASQYHAFPDSRVEILFGGGFGGIIVLLVGFVITSLWGTVLEAWFDE